MIDEGYIKFNYDWIDSDIDYDISEINEIRNRLFDLNFVGAYDGNIGYGNISIRTDDGFLITGATTGNIKKLTEKHYSLVTEYNFDKNSLTCTGRIKASSESLTHAAIYESNDDINAIIHIHSKELWTNLMNRVPTTSKDIGYGTPEMAYELKKFVKICKQANDNIVVMAGHDSGIITFGTNLQEAEIILMENMRW